MSLPNEDYCFEQKSQGETNSVTMQYLHYIQKRSPQHPLKVHKIDQSSMTTFSPSRLSAIEKAC